MGRRRSPTIKTPREIALMRDANRHVAEILEILCDAVGPGVSTWELDKIESLKVHGGDRCEMDEFTKFTPVNGECLARVQLVPSEFITWSK